VTLLEAVKGIQFLGAKLNLENLETGRKDLGRGIGILSS
jgi:hypothetical protein